jgi:hypothetical protein
VWPVAIGLLLFLFATSCRNASEVTTGPTPVKCSVQVQAQTTGFSASGGTGSVRISTPRECGWSAQADAGWVTLGSASSGHGDATLAFVVAANANTTARDAHITVQDRQVVISQQGAACTVRVSSNHESVGPEGGTRTVDVTATSAQCSWTAVSDESWITIAGSGSGAGNGTVSFRVAPTTGPSRSGEVKVGAQVVRVSQTTGCSVSVTPSTASMPVSGGNGTIRVEAAAECAWSAVSGASWITITSGASGSGTGEIRYSVGASGGPGRTGVIKVGEQEVTIKQAAVVDCTLSVSPSTLSFGARAATAHVDVSGAAGCAWSADSRSDWVTITSGAAGNGSGRVTLAIAANAGPGRSGSISVAGHSIAVTQAGGCHYEVSPSAVTIPGNGGSKSVSIATDSACRWTASPGAPWIDVSPSSGTGPATLEIGAGRNLEESRSGSVEVGGHDVTVSQPSSCTIVLAPGSQDYSASGGAGALLVVVSGPCSWTASSRSPWIKITFGSSGTGDGHVEFNVGTNTGAARTGHLRVAGMDFTVRQAAP